MGEGLPTLDEGGVYLPWMGRVYLPWIGEGGTHLGWWRGYLTWSGGGGLPSLEWGRGYLPWTGYVAGGMPLAASRRTFLFYTSFLSS